MKYQWDRERMRSRTPLGWHFKVGGETCLGVGPKWEGCQRKELPSLDRIDIDLLGRLFMEGQVRIGNVRG